jgi:hypothetical protein
VNDGDGGPATVAGSVAAVRVLSGNGSRKATKSTESRKPKSESKRAYTIPGYPTTYVLDRQQRILAKAVGRREWDSAAGREYVRALVRMGL